MPRQHRRHVKKEGLGEVEVQPQLAPPHCQLGLPGDPAHAATHSAIANPEATSINRSFFMAAPRFTRYAAPAPSRSDS